MTLWVILFLAGTLASGFGITYLSQLELSLEERLFHGTVVGLMCVTALGLVIFLAVGLSVVTVVVALALTLAAGATGFWFGRARVQGEAADFAARWAGLGPLPMWLVIVVSWAYLLPLMLRAWTTDAQGTLSAGYSTIWADWAAHLSYAGSFVYGDNRPPIFPIDPGHRLAYPFGIDFLAAMLVKLGSSLPLSLSISSAVLLLALPGLIYLTALRMTGGRAAGVIAALLFFLQGGIGFIYAIGEVDKGGIGTVLHLSRQYTAQADLDYQMLSPLLAYLLPQRSILFGLAVALVSASLLWAARGQAREAPFAFAGVLVGLTPIFHVHGYGTALAMGAIWAVLGWRREWVSFLVPAIALGAPVVGWLLPRGGAASLSWEVGWMAFAGPNQHLPPLQSFLAWLWFWFKNLSFLPGLIAVGTLWRAINRELRLHLAPIWLWFIVPNLASFQVWDWDNTKFFLFWSLFGSILAAAVVVELFRRSVEGRVLAVLLVAVCTVTGALDLGRAAVPSLNTYAFADKDGVDAAAWAGSLPDPHAMFLVAPDHDEPIAALGGRRIVLGYPGWLWSYGLADVDIKQSDVQSMLAGDPSTPALLREYGVAYVVIGPHEMADPWRANQTYWAQQGQLAYSNPEYRIYRVSSSG